MKFVVRGREKSSASVVGTENWKIGDLLLCLCSILPVRYD